MHIDYYSEDKETIVAAYLCIWKNNNCPENAPSHIICLMEDGEKKYDIGKCPMMTSKDQVRILPRSTDKKEKVFCFAVGTERVLLFSGFLMPYSLPVVRKENRFAGVTIKPIESDTNSGEE